MEKYFSFRQKLLNVVRISPTGRPLRPLAPTGPYKKNLKNSDILTVSASTPRLCI